MWSQPRPSCPQRRERASHLGLRKKATRRAGHGQQRERMSRRAGHGWQPYCCASTQNARWFEEEDEETKKKRTRGSNEHRRKIDFCSRRNK